MPKKFLTAVGLVGCMASAITLVAAQTSQGTPLSPHFDTAGAPAEDLIEGVDWAGTTFVAKNLGPQKLEERTFARTTDFPRGLAFQSNDDLLAAIGSGTTSDMRIEKWTSGGHSHFVQFQWHNYTAADFKDPEKIKERVAGETKGVFWFFAGPLAVDGKDQVYFNLGACGPNGLYKLLQINPIQVQMLFSSGWFETLQFYPNASENLYLTTFSKIIKIDPATTKSVEDGIPFFSLVGGHASLLDTLVIDQDHILATLAVNRLDPKDSTHKRRLPSNRIAVVFDRKLQGYYVMDFEDWGPMAIRPSDQTFFRFDAKAKEIRQFTMPFLTQNIPSQASTAPGLYCQN